MDANELADRLKLVRCLAGGGQVLNEAEAMLRQQQAEIETEKLYSSMKHDEVLALKAEIAILKRAQEK